jgi:hypothetical protein
VGVTGGDARSRRDDKKKGEVKGAAAKGWLRQLIRPQSRGLRASSDVSQVAVHPHFHCGQV